MGMCAELERLSEAAVGLTKARADEKLQVRWKAGLFVADRGYAQWCPKPSGGVVLEIRQGFSAFDTGQVWYLDVDVAATLRDFLNRTLPAEEGEKA